MAQGLANLFQTFFIMKTLFLILAITAFNFTSMRAQTPSINVPANIKSEFKASYPRAAAVEWQQVNDKYKVMFTDAKNLHHTIIYQKDGKLFSRESELDEQQVPKTIRDYYIENYPSESSYRVCLRSKRRLARRTWRYGGVWITL